MLITYKNTTMPTRILIIDDEQSFVRSLIFALEETDIEATCAYSGEDGLAMVARDRPDIVLLDLRLPGIGGMEVLEALTRDYPGLSVVMISAHGDTRAAVQAAKAGAADYLTKPFALDELLHLISNTTERIRLRSELDYHRDRAASASGLVGESDTMGQLWQTIQRVAASSAGRILLQGESGTGKAVVARAIHSSSPRTAEAFVEINCAALPEQLIEAELFGAKKGAYTGAHQTRIGLVALADGGTLFLDEVGELPLLLQAKLLHFLEDGSYRPVGSNRSRTANARVIAATNRPLETEVREGRFREDLFFRLNVIELLIPPLRERGNDISLMLEQFAEIQAREERCQVIHYALETLETLRHYGWPGNVRELKNLVERLTILYPGQLIEASHLPVEMQREDLHPDFLGERMKRTERQIVMEALSQTGGHKGKAAEFLGLSRHAFKRRLQRLGLE